NGGPWTLMAPADPASGRYTALYPAGPATEGIRTVMVRASDKAGNNDQTSSSDSNPVALQFVVDITPPQIDLSGIAEGAYFNRNVAPAVRIIDSNPGPSTILLDGAPYAGAPITGEKTYLLEIHAKDLAGNGADRVVHFTIDKTPPAITIEGVVEGTTYPAAVTPTITITDLSPVSQTASLNGAPFVSGTAIGADGPYTLDVLASDPAGNSAHRAVHFTLAQNRPPVANAGPDQNVIVGQPVTLAGTASSDPDGDPITYHWTVLQVPSGSAVATSSLSGAAGPKPTFTPDLVGAYVVELFVDDSKASSVSDQMVVQAERPPNVPPNADAGPDQNVLIGAQVLMNGLGSGDPDNGPQPLTYSWSFAAVPTGSKLATSQIAGRFTSHANFVPDVAGTYTVRLTVSDGSGASSDEVLIKAAANTPPVANAGPDISIKLKQAANLDGSASKDPDLRPSPLTYSWSFVSKPSYSKLTNANIQNRTEAKASFIPDVRGTYVLSLTVNDGASSSSDNVAVTVRPVYIHGDGNDRHGGYDEKFSFDIRDQSGMIEPSSWIKFSFAKLNLNAVAGLISSIDVDGNTATITGTFTINGAAGYRFVATLVDGTPDTFGIAICRPNGALLYQYSGKVTLGNLIIEE